MLRLASKADLDGPNTLNSHDASTLNDDNSSYTATNSISSQAHFPPRASGNLRSKGRFTNSLSNISSYWKHMGKDSIDSSQNHFINDSKPLKERSWSSFLQDVISKRATLTNEAKLEKDSNSSSILGISAPSGLNPKTPKLYRFSSLRSPAAILSRATGNIGKSNEPFDGGKPVSRGWSFRSKLDVSVTHHNVENQCDISHPYSKPLDSNNQAETSNAICNHSFNLDSKRTKSPVIPTRKSSSAIPYSNQLHSMARSDLLTSAKNDHCVSTPIKHDKKRLELNIFKGAGKLISSSTVAAAPEAPSGMAQSVKSAKVAVFKRSQSIPRKPVTLDMSKYDKYALSNTLEMSRLDCSNSATQPLVTVSEKTEEKLHLAADKNPESDENPAVISGSNIETLKPPLIIVKAKKFSPSATDHQVPVVRDSVQPSKPLPEFPKNKSGAPAPASGALTATDREEIERTKRQHDLACLMNGSKKLSHAFHSKYTLGDMLGDGAFGFVVTAFQKLDNREIAIKFIAKSKIARNLWVPFNEATKDPVPLEVALLHRLKHPNIIQYIDYLNEENYVLLVTELHGTSWDSVPSPGKKEKDEEGINRLVRVKSLGSTKTTNTSNPIAVTKTAPTTTLNFGKAGVVKKRTSCDLFECIDAHTCIPENIARHIFAQIAMVVEYLNSNGIVHRDLKDENIVINSDYCIKLIDFGSASRIPQKVEDYFSKFNGTAHFASPEIARGNSYRGPEAEIWALGVLLYTIIFGENPFQNRAEIIKGTFSFPMKINSDLKNLLESMLCYEMTKRATINDVLNHRWLESEVKMLKANYRAKSRSQAASQTIANDTSN
ncbi:hypothetical protein QVD99_001729 [Batrachochytrium dendrobatidis]|nr:hypothetical protein O5D80_000376 [Batrachochytrium dendrobatidis]KAK5671903.1 hypothetical protein QVD99_001729 [Batrachochytrium dendrobatidis]